MKAVSIAIALSLTCLFGFLYFTSYRSAFEADQACHSDKFNEFNDSADVGCDHDLETNQWILYQIKEKSPALVVKRYRY